LSLVGRSAKPEVARMHWPLISASTEQAANPVAAGAAVIVAVTAWERERARFSKQDSRVEADSEQHGSKLWQASHIVSTHVALGVKQLAVAAWH
jgi:hypothetical protein